MENDCKEVNDRAQALMGEEQWTEAIKLIESQPQMFERDADLSWNLGWAYFKLGNWKTAQHHLSRATRLDPIRGASWWALGIAQMEDGILDEAEINVKEALRLRDSTHFRSTLALILMQRGKVAEAEQVHLTGLELKPDSPERWRAYACFLDDLGRQPEAEAAYKKARLFTGN